MRFQKLEIGSMRSETLMFLLVSVRGVGRRGELGDDQGSFYMLIILYEPMIHPIPFSITSRPTKIPLKLCDPAVGLTIFIN